MDQICEIRLKLIRPTVLLHFNQSNRSWDIVRLKIALYGVEFFMATLNDFCLITTASTDSKIQILNSLVQAPGEQNQYQANRKCKTRSLADAKLVFYVCWRKNLNVLPMFIFVCIEYQHICHVPVLDLPHIDRLTHTLTIGYHKIPPFFFFLKPIKQHRYRKATARWIKNCSHYLVFLDPLSYSIVSTWQGTLQNTALWFNLTLARQP